jgi:hypothetical protein
MNIDKKMNSGNLSNKMNNDNEDETQPDIVNDGEGETSFKNQHQIYSDQINTGSNNNSPTTGALFLNESTGSNWAMAEAACTNHNTIDADCSEMMMMEMETSTINNVNTNTNSSLNRNDFTSKLINASQKHDQKALTSTVSAQRTYQALLGQKQTEFDDKKSTTKGTTKPKNVTLSLNSKRTKGLLMNNGEIIPPPPPFPGASNKELTDCN